MQTKVVEKQRKGRPDHGKENSVIHLSDYTALPQNKNLSSNPVRIGHMLYVRKI